jgi:hypothetical protein
MPNLRHKVLRQLLFVAAELLRTQRDRAFDSCIRGYLSITFTLPVVASLAKLREAVGVADTLVQRLKEPSCPTYNFQPVRCRATPPHVGKFVSVAECCLAMMQHVPATLVEEGTLKQGVRALLDADPEVGGEAVG